MRSVVLALLGPVLLAGSSLRERIDPVLAGQRAFWGIQIVRVETGEILYARNENQFFVPASNVKLFSTALALERLGPDHRFHTRITFGSGLRLIGGGDPTLSARTVPYKRGPVQGDPLRAIEELAGQVAARGITRIDGDIIGDDTAYLRQPYPEGWTQDDALWEYGAPVSALSINDNSVSLTVRPATRPGEPGRIQMSPSLEYFFIDNRTVTTVGGETDLRIHRMPGSNQLLLAGTVSRKQGGRTVRVAVENPALYAAIALRDALIRRGIDVTGRALAKHCYANEVPSLKLGPLQTDEPAEQELARLESPPLVEVLQIINKVSQNLHAEMVLHEVGRVRRNLGSREAGLEELKVFLKEAGIGEREYNIEDGSGLSRRNLATPASITRLLLLMHRSANREAWVELLPVGGEDGTLSGRFQGTAVGGRIWAKTGTLQHATALSGYARARSGDLLAFSILVNNYNAPGAAVRAVLDKICSLMIQWG